MGMYTICYYERFSIADIGKFERRLTNWCNEVEDIHGRAMLVFDETSLALNCKPKEYKDETGKYYTISLPNVSFTYTKIADTAQCVMYKIWENRTQSVMYNMPKTWESTEMWLGR